MATTASPGAPSILYPNNLGRKGSGTFAMPYMERRNEYERDWCQTEGRSAAVYPTNTLSRLHWIDSDGSDVELVDTRTDGVFQFSGFSCISGSVTGALANFNRYKEFVSKDGSSMTFVSEADILDDSGYDSIVNAGTLYKKDGTRYRIEGGNLKWISDRNGNLVSFIYSVNDREKDANGNWVTTTDPYNRPLEVNDALNRRISIYYGIGSTHPNEDYIEYPGFAGIRRVTIRYQAMSTMMGGVAVKKVKELFPVSAVGDQPGVNNYDFNPTLPSELELPNGRKFPFGYNIYGELSKVKLPTDGVITYDWSGHTASGDGLYDESLIYRRLDSRKVYAADGSTPLSQTDYESANLEQAATPYQVTEKEKDGSGVVLRTKEHIFHGSPTTSSFLTQFKYSGWREGREYSTAVKDGGTTLQNVAHTFGQRGANNAASEPSDESTRPNDPRVIKTTTTLGSVSAVRTFVYSVDAHNNVTKECESDFGSVANVRCVDRTYVTDDGWVKAPTHLRGLLLSESIGDGTTAESQTSYEYDIYAGNLVPTYADIERHDPDRRANYIKRGNITKETRTGPSGITAVTTVTYDVAGNPLTVTTPSVELEAGQTPTTPVTALAYADAYTDATGKGTYAFPTTIANAKGQEQKRSYHWASARLTNIKDANLNDTSYSYSDALDRLKLVTLPIGRTEFDYDDANRQIVTRKRLESGGTMVTQTLEYDGLGRTVKTKLSEGATEIVTTQEYDALGRVSKVSNPTRGTPSEFTTTAYDNLDRPTLVTQPDGSQDRACYTNNEVLRADAAGKWSKTIHDGLGRLTSAVEDATGTCQSLTNTGSTDTTNLQTTYLYYARDLLKRVTQGTLALRSFEYDSLGRMTSATNPESGAITYAYDAAGNVKSRSMSDRSVAMKYDLLHRLVRKTYTDATNTPEVTYCYDGNTAGACASAPTGTGKNLTGRLTMVNSSAARVKYGQYDALGRVTSHELDFGAAPYVFGYAYNDLMLTAETYPSGRVVSYAPDAVGRVGRVTGTKSGEAAKTYASGTSGTLGNQIDYTAHGAVDQLKLGNGVWETTCFNSRLQMARLAAGSTSTLASACGASITGTDYSALRLDYGYATGNNGNLASQTIWTGRTQLETQSYSYDALNRLKTVVAGGWRQTYVFDRYGNRALLSGTVNGNYVPDQPAAPLVTADVAAQVEAQFANNRWTGSTPDAVGNITQPATGASPTLTDDGENRISGAVQGGTMSFAYDGEGRRVKKTVGTVTTTYVHDALGRLVAEYGGTVDASGLQYVTVDHLGSTRLVTDVLGAVVKRYDYLPFGQELPVGKGGRTSDLKYQAFGFDDPQRVKFTGKERDSETGWITSWRGTSRARRGGLPAQIPSTPMMN